MKPVFYLNEQEYVCFDDDEHICSGPGIQWGLFRLGWEARVKETGWVLMMTREYTFPSKKDLSAARELYDEIFPQGGSDV